MLDEADILGDSIAVVKDGRLRALGTSSFLKQRFGLGYLLRTSLTPEANHQQVLARVTQCIPEANLVSSAGTELAIRLPKGAVDVFPELFESIEVHGKGQGILSYGIETTTLEEVMRLRLIMSSSVYVCVWTRAFLSTCLTFFPCVYLVCVCFYAGVYAYCE